MDEDVVGAYHQAVAVGQAKSVVELAKHRGKFDVRASEDFNGKWLSSYQVAGRLTFGGSGCGDLSVTMDASRIGNPAR